MAYAEQIRERAERRRQEREAEARIEAEEAARLEADCARLRQEQEAELARRREDEVRASLPTAKVDDVAIRMKASISIQNRGVYLFRRHN